MQEVRDPVHGYINVNEKEKSLIDTQVFQRLRRIKQLAHAYLIYPGANHTRFEHSLGALHLAARITNKFKAFLKNESNSLIRYAALLHDIGHGSFSHVSEFALEENTPAAVKEKYKNKKIHEVITEKILMCNEEINKEVAQKDIEKIVDILNGEDGLELSTGIVSGPIDVDKQDYLLRDSLFCGVKYGLYDIERLINTLTVIIDGFNTYLGLEDDGQEALEQFVLARYYMNTQVYAHKGRLITDKMMTRAIRVGIEEDDIPILKNLYVFEDVDDYVTEYIKWDDDSLTREILKNFPKTKAESLFSKLRKRELYKEVYREPLETIANPELMLEGPNDDEVVKLEGLIADELNFEPWEIMVNIFNKQSLIKPKEGALARLLLAQKKDPKKPVEFVNVSTLYSKTEEETSKKFLAVYIPPFEFSNEADKKIKIKEYNEKISGVIATVFGRSDLDGP